MTPSPMTLPNQDSAGSVTWWIEDLKQGDEKAAQRVWERYFERLVALARKKLGDSPRRVADEEDVAVCAFDSLFRGVKQGRFPLLHDRDDLWRLLVVITARKAINQVVHTGRQKRGHQKVRGESVFGDANDPAGLASILGAEPTPELAAMVAEEYRRLLQVLDPGQLRRIAVLKLEGYTHEEIAAQLGCAKRTVIRKLRVIRKKFEELACHD